MEFASFGELESYLRDFTTWDRGADFDFGAAIHLFGACLDCLRARALDAEIEAVPDHLSEEQLAFLEELATRVRTRKGDE
jgi:hypothetical protein